MQEKHASKWSFSSEYQCTVSVAGLGIRIHFWRFRVQLFFSIRIQLHTTNTVPSDEFAVIKILINLQLLTISMRFPFFLFFIFFLLDPHPGEKIEFGSGSTAQNSTGSLYFTSKTMFPSNLL